MSLPYCDVSSISGLESMDGGLYYVQCAMLCSVRCVQGSAGVRYWQLTLLSHQRVASRSCDSTLASEVTNQSIVDVLSLCIAPDVMCSYVEI